MRKIEKSPSLRPKVRPVQRLSAALLAELTDHLTELVRVDLSGYSTGGAMGRLYAALEEKYRDAFRIFRSLALRADAKYPPQKFFQSCGECAARLGLREMMTAWRILQKFIRWKILLPLDRGTRRTGGKAAVFAWNLPTPLLAVTSTF